MLARSEVVLDSFHFGGNNSSLEAFALGKPVVTLPSEYLRARYTQGCYAEMGLSELVARTPGDYADRAVRLACDAGYRRETEARVLERCDRLFERTDAAVSLGERLLELLP